MARHGDGLVEPASSPGDSRKTRIPRTGNRHRYQEEKTASSCDGRSVQYVSVPSLPCRSNLLGSDATILASAAPAIASASPSLPQLLALHWTDLEGRNRDTSWVGLSGSEPSCKTDSLVVGMCMGRLSLSLSHTHTHTLSLSLSD
ncbi:unnamed protein product [Diplocarpon coronariae]